MLKGVIAISGQPGLFKVIAESKNNIVVESLETGKRSAAYSTNKISALDDIAIYTTSSDVPLKDVFKLIYEKENGAAAVDPKSPAPILKSYFEGVMPDYDKNRVYISDIKKVVTWYNLLQKREMLKFEEEETAGEAADQAEGES